MQIVGISVGNNVYKGKPPMSYTLAGAASSSGLLTGTDVSNPGKLGQLLIGEVYDTPTLHKNGNEMACNIDGIELIDHLLYVLSISPVVESKLWNNFIIIFPHRESLCLPNPSVAMGLQYKSTGSPLMPWPWANLNFCSIEVYFGCCRCHKYTWTFLPTITS